MKTLTVQISDEVYQRVERRASVRGTTIGAEVVEWLERLPADQDEVEKQILTEIAAMPGLPRDKLITLAEKRKPPQSWYDEEDDLF